MSKTRIEALLALGGGGRPTVGRERIALLEAVGTEGSITKAAKAIGLSYKAAWDALAAINNMLPRPAVLGQSGGRKGGGAVLTEDGKALIMGFHALQERLAKAAEALTDGDPANLADPFTLLWSLGMKTSARNAFRCRIEEVRPGAVSVEVLLRLTATTTLAAIITRDALEELGIKQGDEVMALIKASFIMLASGTETPKVSARNRVMGKVSRREDGPVSCEVVLDIGDGRSITSVITKDGAEELDLKEGDTAWALFKAGHVILAVG